MMLAFLTPTGPFFSPVLELQFYLTALRICILCIAANSPRKGCLRELMSLRDWIMMGLTAVGASFTIIAIWALLALALLQGPSVGGLF
jgi:hypothetical protein